MKAPAGFVKTAIYTCSRDTLCRFLEEEQEDGEFDHFLYSKHSFGYSRACKAYSEMLIFPGTLSLEAFSTHVIPV